MAGRLNSEDALKLAVENIIHPTLQVELHRKMSHDRREGG
jgi:hypothetical protein